MLVDNVYRFGELNPENKAKVMAYVRELLAEQSRPPEPEPRPDREVVEIKKAAAVTYQHEKIKCGKKNCKCAQGALHGPYWYAYSRNDKGRVVSKYIGKRLPEDVTTV